MSKRLTNEEYKERVFLVSSNIEILGEYQGSSKHIEAKCNICGYVWNPIADSLLRKHGCPKCAGNVQLSHEQFAKRCSEMNPHIKLMSEYKSSTERVKCKCTKCGDEFEVIASSLSKKYGCAMCSNRKKKTIEVFTQELEKINPNVEIIGEYKNTNLRVKSRCKKCGLCWDPRAGNLLKG